MIDDDSTQPVDSTAPVPVAISQARRLPGPVEVWELAQAEIDAHLKAQTTFTAYTITLTLRRQHPYLEILHDVVRDYVHDTFESGTSPLATSYTRSGALFNGREAWEYTPRIDGSVADDEDAGADSDSIEAELGRPPTFTNRPNQDDGGIPNWAQAEPLPGVKPA